MIAYTLRRLLQMIPLLFFVSLAIYTLVALQPGDPLEGLIFQNPHLTQEDIAKLKAAYGLDQPIHIRYFKWLGRALQGDLGLSRTYAQPAAQFIYGRMQNTLLLTGLSFLLALAVAIPVGVFSAVRQYSIADYVVTFFSFVGYSTPVFWLGIMLMLLFAVWLPERLGRFEPIFPAGGFVSPGMSPDTVGWWAYLKDRAWYLVLPVFTLSVLSMAGWTRFTRSSMLEVLQQDYIRTARSKGLAERVVIYKHALRNALIPIVTLVGLAIPGLFSGAVITETIFSWPGMGRALFDSLLEKDYNVAMAALVFLAFLTALFNLLADLAYAVVDPRIRYN
ncbi:MULTISPECIES: ABC transporter permease [Oceanithermus]|uniref:Peptide ABC transporter permease n=3 Tax=Oceanithermus TaxID=208447 RepID=A0A511RGJ6_9DEIN|nr:MULTISPECIES: ABC transporter permease [Oceanithermus]MBB6030207.1 peptide/nickel transport system permease protein [Oceanithermus desulfurans]GEM88765.1 peptide ABC transporter permease [Oceanithermus desulfurans NBRC 100063]HHO58269.1 ABC transporter permease [Oceanithermus profundus]